MARELGEGLTPKKLRDRLDSLACMSDALEILSRVAEDEENRRDRCRRAMGALAHEISAGLDALYGEVHDALEDPTSFLGKRVRK